MRTYGWQIAELFATGPTRSKILRLAPSKLLFQRIRQVKIKGRKRCLSVEEEWELKQFRFERQLMQLVKAIVRDGDATY